MPAAQEFLVNAFMAVTAISGRELGRDHESVMLLRLLLARRSVAIQAVLDEDIADLALEQTQATGHRPGVIGRDGAVAPIGARGEQDAGRQGEETKMSVTTTAVAGLTPRVDDHIEAVYSKVGWRIMPLLIVCYIVAYLDRINIGYALLQMKQTLPFTDAVYALGAGIFFIGYFLFEVPSNLMLEKVGARKTLLRIMFCWGIAAAAMMFVQTPTQFYVMRFLLGAFEAGFFPGVILYLTYWYPPARRGQIIAIFMTAATIAVMIAGPPSGAIMKWMSGLNGWHGWQWLFLVQGLPASILGMVAFFYLQDKPEDAQWLDSREKKVLRDHLAVGVVPGARPDAVARIDRRLAGPLLCAQVSVPSLVAGADAPHPAGGVELPLAERLELGRRAVERQRDPLVESDAVAGEVSPAVAREDHRRLRDARQQGARGDRGALPVRLAVRPDRGGGPPAERGTLHGRVRGRERPGAARRPQHGTSRSVRANASGPRSGLGGTTF